MNYIDNIHKYIKEKRKEEIEKGFKIICKTKRFWRMCKKVVDGVERSLKYVWKDNQLTFEYIAAIQDKFTKERR